MKILVTGCAGFIGSHLAERLVREKHKIVGIDNFNDYYDPKVKEKNIAKLVSSPLFTLHRVDILDNEKIRNIFKQQQFDRVVHLAARAGVRSSFADPELYAQVNCLGTTNLLKASVDFGIRQFIFGSSSSVYGNSGVVPFTEDDLCSAIVSPYAASKRSAEFIVETFARVYSLQSTVLRFFTVYGERGRPDMAPALLMNAIFLGKPFFRFGDGSSSRDYTYVEDIVDGICHALKRVFDFEVINLGNNHPVVLNNFIKICEEITGKKAVVKNASKSMGDVEKTWASVVKAKKLLSWTPKVDLKSGMRNYYEWLKEDA